MEDLQESSLLSIAWMKVRVVTERLFLAGIALIVINIALGVIDMGHVFSFPSWVWIQLRVFVWLYGLIIGLRLLDASICRRWHSSNSEKYITSVICTGFSLLAALSSQMWFFALPLLVVSCGALFTAEVHVRPVKQHSMRQHRGRVATPRVSTCSRRQGTVWSSNARKEVSQRIPTQLSQKVVICRSASDKDKRYVRELNIQLQSVERLGVEIWDEAKIPAGALRQQHIEHAIASAGAAIVLVSPDLLASSFVQSQLSQILGRAMSGGTVIFLLYVSSCLYQLYGLDRFEPVNPPSKPLAGMTSREARNRVYVDLLINVCHRLGIIIL